MPGLRTRSTITGASCSRLPRSRPCSASDPKPALAGNENALVQAIRRGASNSFNQTGQQIVSRNLNIQPTLTIRPGFPVRVIVNRDLVLAPYEQGGAR